MEEAADYLCAALSQDPLLWCAYEDLCLLGALPRRACQQGALHAWHSCSERAAGGCQRLHLFLAGSLRQGWDRYMSTG